MTYISTGRKKIVAGNWKMNKNLDEVRLFVNELNQKLKESKAEVVIFPSFPFLMEIYSSIVGDLVKIGAQDCSEKAYGAYTGDVSAQMIRSVGARYIMVGHSERRVYHQESDDLLFEKIKQILSCGLRVMFCCGESLDERRASMQYEVVARQLERTIFRLNSEQVQSVDIAYEPVWAIGTGLTANPSDAQEMHQFIRKGLERQFGLELATQISILYGGSCNPTNAESLFSMPDIDGGLIGGASLVVDDFIKLIEIMNRLESS